MQKMMYMSNSRDFTNQKNINENRYFKQMNTLLDESWKVSSLTPNVAKIDSNGETFAAFVVLEKPDEVR